LVEEVFLDFSQKSSFLLLQLCSSLGCGDHFDPQKILEEGQNFWVVSDPIFLLGASAKRIACVLSVRCV